MKNLAAWFVRLRNPQFAFDPSLSAWDLQAFARAQFWGLARGWLKLLPRFKRPKMALLGKGVALAHPGQLSFGPYLKLGDGVLLNALGKNGLRIGAKVGIGAYSRVVVSGSFQELGEHIIIGDHVGIGEFAYLGGGGGLEIGDDCIIGQYFSCHPENHQAQVLDVPIRKQGVSRKGISIGRNCWIGSKVTVLDGVRLGNGCIVAAGAVVTRSFPDNTIIGGVPARILKNRTAL